MFALIPHFYWQHLIARAISEALDFFDTGPRAIGLAILGALVTATIVLFARGWDKFKQHIIENVLIAFGGALATWVLVFLWFLVYEVPHEINVQAEHIGAPRLSFRLSLPTGWNVKFMQPFCYVIFETFKPLLINGRVGFPVLVLSDVGRPWDGVHVRIRRADRTEYLVDEEVGTLRIEGAILNHVFSPDVNQPYFVTVLTRSRPDYFYETLTLTQASGSFEQQVQVYRVQQHGSARLLFDSVVQGRLP